MGDFRWDEFVDVRGQAEQERLALLEQVFDPFSTRNLDRLGAGPGWRCLEVGAGAGSIAMKLADRCGPRNVTATDLDTTALEPLAEFGVRVLRHDITADPRPGT